MRGRQLGKSWLNHYIIGRLIEIGFTGSIKIHGRDDILNIDFDKLECHRTPYKIIGKSAEIIINDLDQTCPQQINNRTKKGKKVKHQLPFYLGSRRRF